MTLSASEREARAEARTHADAPRRLLFIDNLRWSAIALVVVLHAAVTYSGIGSWYVRDHGQTRRAVVIGLATYQSLQHAVAMGLLFGIAGHFAGAALERRGIRSFLKERAYRLGLPLLLYMFVIGPLTEYYLSRTWHAQAPRTFGQAWWRHVENGAILSGSGPLWFCLVLLVLCLMLAAVRSVWPAPPVAELAPPPSPTTIAVFAAAMAAATFALGLAAPGAGTVLNIVVHDLPQYPLMFAAGVMAQRRGWLLRLPSWYGPAGTAAGVIVGLVWWFTMLELGGAFRGQLAAFFGGWHWQSAAMDLWRSLTCLALAVGLVTLSRDHFDRQGRLARFLTVNAFGVYLFHPPILIAITMTLRGVPVDNLLKFMMAGLTAVVATFLFVGLVARRVPLLRAAL